MRVAECCWCKKVTQVNYAFEGKRYCAGEYCASCYDIIGIEPRERNRTNSKATLDDISPWQENAIRQLEDG